MTNIFPFILIKKNFLSKEYCKIYPVGNKNQYPKAVIIASDSFP